MRLTQRGQECSCTQLVCGVINLLSLVVWAMYPSLYNTIYTDFIPPSRGVQRRIVEEE